MNELPQQLVNGLLLGSMYGLVAVGYTMVYGIVQLINFAHGEIFMTGGFGALTVWLILPGGTTMWVALPLMIIGAVLVATTIAVGAERLAYRPLRGGPRLAPSSPPSVSRSPSSRPSGPCTRRRSPPGPSRRSPAAPSSSAR